MVKKDVSSLESRGDQIIKKLALGMGVLPSKSKVFAAAAYSNVGVGVSIGRYTSQSCNCEYQTH